jgi:hypothetical protein
MPPTAHSAAAAGAPSLQKVGASQRSKHVPRAKHTTAGTAHCFVSRTTAGQFPSGIEYSMGSVPNRLVQQDKPRLAALYASCQQGCRDSRAGTRHRSSPEAQQAHGRSAWLQARVQSHWPHASQHVVLPATNNPNSTCHSGRLTPAGCGDSGCRAMTAASKAHCSGTAATGYTGQHCHAPQVQGTVPRNASAGALPQSSGSQRRSADRTTDSSPAHQH